MAAIHRELTEKQSLSFTLSFPPNKMELTAAKADGTESYIFEFPNPDARQSFEQAFEDTKKKLGKQGNWPAKVGLYPLQWAELLGRIFPP